MAWGDKGSQKESDKEGANRKSLTEMSSYNGNYSHMDGGIMDGRWKGIGDDDGDDLLQIPVPVGCRTEFLVLNHGFWWWWHSGTLSGKNAEPP
jgi:hypothetical protein